MKQRAKVEENCYYVKTVAEALYTAQKCLPQRGHDESASSKDHGNLLELMNLISEHEDRIKKNLKHGPKNATYSFLQNELMIIMANINRLEIRSEVEKSECFELIVHESKDVCKQEQVSIILR